MCGCIKCLKGNMTKDYNPILKVTSFVNPITDTYVRLINKDNNIINWEQTKEFNNTLNTIINKSDKLTPRYKIVNAIMQLACNSDECQLN